MSASDILYSAAHGAGSHTPGTPLPQTGMSQGSYQPFAGGVPVPGGTSPSVAGSSTDHLQLPPMLPNPNVVTSRPGTAPARNAREAGLEGILPGRVASALPSNLDRLRPDFYSNVRHSYTLVKDWLNMSELGKRLSRPSLPSLNCDHKNCDFLQRA